MNDLIDWSLKIWNQILRVLQGTMSSMDRCKHSCLLIDEILHGASRPYQIQVMWPEIVVVQDPLLNV